MKEKVSQNRPKFFFQYSLPKIETRFIRLLESFSRAASVISVPRKSSIGVVKTLKINEYLTFSGHIFTNFESNVVGMSKEKLFDESRS